MMSGMKRTVIVVLLLAAIAKPASAQSAASIRQAVQRSLPMVQKSAAEFVAKRACFSCHHNALTILTLHLARDKGFAIDAKVLDAVEEKTFRPLRGPNALDDAVQAVNLSDPTPNDSLLLMSAHAAGVASDLTTAVFAARLMRWQRAGHWVTSDFRPPHSSSLFTATATAVRAIRFYAPEEMSAERDKALSDARRWLLETQPESTEDASFRLLGLVWSGAKKEEVGAATRDLLQLQKSGAWSQLPNYDADAYSTGQALFALREAGMPASDRAWQSGLKFLLSTQSREGVWRIRTRMLSPAEVSPMYFPTGFPFGKDEFLSYAGSCWALMALLSALPDADSPAQPPPVETASVAAPWLRTALFGSAAELTRLLDAGLSPNAATANGSTLMMLSVPDAEKVRLLLSRGADVKARSANGTDALTIAAAYRDTAASIRLLLGAGADAETPESVHARHAPLVFAAMTGDIENVRLLLSRGAKPASEALSEAVTFGYPDVVRTLIDAGADASVTAQMGINLLHWATIANRFDVIPVLAAARVPLDDTDDFGFTPLMYAATIDHGSTRTVQSLLKAGADTRIRNTDGRTPRDQAIRLKHTSLAAALR